MKAEFLSNACMSVGSLLRKFGFVAENLGWGDFTTQASSTRELLPESQPRAQGVKRRRHGRANRRAQREGRDRREEWSIQGRSDVVELTWDLGSLASPPPLIPDAAGLYRQENFPEERPSGVRRGGALDQTSSSSQAGSWRGEEATTNSPAEAAGAVDLQVSHPVTGNSVTDTTDGSADAREPATVTASSSGEMWRSGSEQQAQHGGADVGAAGSERERELIATLASQEEEESGGIRTSEGSVQEAGKYEVQDSWATEPGSTATGPGSGGSMMQDRSSEDAETVLPTAARTNAPGAGGSAEYGEGDGNERWRGAVTQDGIESGTAQQSGAGIEAGGSEGSDQRYGEGMGTQRSIGTGGGTVERGSLGAGGLQDQSVPAEAVQMDASGGGGGAEVAGMMLPSGERYQPAEEGARPLSDAVHSGGTVPGTTTDLAGGPHQTDTVASGDVDNQAVVGGTVLSGSYRRGDPAEDAQEHLQGGENAGAEQSEGVQHVRIPGLSSETEPVPPQMPGSAVDRPEAVQEQEGTRDGSTWPSDPAVQADGAAREGAHPEHAGEQTQGGEMDGANGGTGTGSPVMAEGGTNGSAVGDAAVTPGQEAGDPVPGSTVQPEVVPEGSGTEQPAASAGAAARESEAMRNPPVNPLRQANNERAVERAKQIEMGDPQGGLARPHATCCTSHFAMASS